jgi:hypothetical protein
LEVRSVLFSCGVLTWARTGLFYLISCNPTGALKCHTPGSCYLTRFIVSPRYFSREIPFFCAVFRKLCATQTKRKLSLTKSKERKAVKFAFLFSSFCAVTRVTAVSMEPQHPPDFLSFAWDTPIFIAIVLPNVLCAQMIQRSGRVCVRRAWDPPLLSGILAPTALQTSRPI